MTMKELFAPSDMTVGKPWEKIVAFTIPMLIGNIAQQLYNTVDSIVIGKYVGDNALAAVGSASPILNLLLVLFVGISVGAGVMVSQYFGARQRKELSMMIGNCVTLTAISSIIIMILGAVLSRPLLEMLKTPDSIIDWCTSYLVILMVGCAGSAYYNILCGILRGLGDSISALIYLLVATVINIVLDIVFVSQFHMGVAGVAYATVIAQAISAVVSMVSETEILKERFYNVFLARKKLRIYVTVFLFGIIILSFSEMQIARQIWSSSHIENCPKCKAAVQGEVVWDGWENEKNVVCTHQYAWGDDLQKARYGVEKIRCNECGNFFEIKIRQEKIVCHGYND